MSVPARNSPGREVDHAAAEILLYLPFIRSAVRFATWRTGSLVHDEDLEQEALLRVLQAMSRIRRIEYPKALVVKIVHDTVADHWRRRRVLDRIDAIPERFLAYRPAVDEWLDDRQRLRLVRRALSHLSPQKREAIELFYFSEHSVGDIARRFRSSPSAVKMTLLRGRRELRQTIGVDSIRAL